LLYLKSQKPPFNAKLHGSVIDTFSSIAIDDDFLLAFLLLPWVLHPSMGLYCNVIMGDPPHPKILFFSLMSLNFGTQLAFGVSTFLLLQLYSCMYQSGYIFVKHIFESNPRLSITSRYLGAYTLDSGVVQ
jgi:hypothetical protein